MEETIKNGEINFDKEGYTSGFWLSHSCDEWVIGDLEDAKKFAEDLLLTIKQVEEKYPDLLT